MQRNASTSIVRQRLASMKQDQPDSVSCLPRKSYRFNKTHHSNTDAHDKSGCDEPTLKTLIKFWSKVAFSSTHPDHTDRSCRYRIRKCWSNRWKQTDDAECNTKHFKRREIPLQFLLVPKLCCFYISMYSHESAQWICYPAIPHPQSQPIQSWRHDQPPFLAPFLLPAENPNLATTCYQIPRTLSLEWIRSQSSSPRRPSFMYPLNKHSGDKYPRGESSLSWHWTFDKDGSTQVPDCRDLCDAVVVLLVQIFECLSDLGNCLPNSDIKSRHGYC